MTRFRGDNIVSDPATRCRGKRGGHRKYKKKPVILVIRREETTIRRRLYDYDDDSRYIIQVYIINII